MQRPLDPLSFKKNRYERPNQDWVCGHAADGHACPLGPDARGGCRHTGECLPAKKGDRWLCMRSDAAGGKCAEGPLPAGACAHPIPPCQPVPSIRRARGSAVWLFLALTSGALLVLLGSNYLRPRWTDPGPLTSAHATSAAKCSDCHAVDRASIATLTNLTALDRNRRADGQLCLKCHALGDYPFTPHSVTPTRLIALEQQLSSLPNESQNRTALLRASHEVNPVRSDNGELACMSCHQEHHGRKFDLQKLSDAQCQSCHSIQFASFRRGHPEFSSYPSRIRTPIFFDHASHLQQHFAAMKTKAPTSCQDCHVPDGAGRFMQVKSFAQTCAACHEAQIEGEGATTKGAAFFTLPGIDADTLAAKGIAIGEWPKFADGKITPFTELLLRRQPAMGAVLDKLQGVDLLDLSKATPEQLAAAESFAWGVKKLLYHFVSDGQSYLTKTFAGGLAPAGAEIPRAAFLAAQQEWMPHLLTEVAAYEKGTKPPLPESKKFAPAPNESKPKTAADDSLGGDDLTAGVAASPAPSAAPNDDLTGGDLSQAAGVTPTPAPTTAPTPEPEAADAWVSAGGWYRPDQSFTLYYRPTGHADAFFVAWLTTGAKMAGDNSTAAATAFRQMANPESAGLCFKCHTSVTKASVTQVQWQPAESLPKKKSFTTFRHTTHLSLFGKTACETCHRIDSKSGYAQFFRGETGEAANRDAARFQSNFAPLAKTLCLQCHQPSIAGDSCLLCHRYHVGATEGVMAGRNMLRPLLGEK